MDREETENPNPTFVEYLIVIGFISVLFVASLTFLQFMGEPPQSRVGRSGAAAPEGTSIPGWTPYIVVAWALVATLDHFSRKGKREQETLPG